MSTIWYAFNVTRQSFINLGVTAADTFLARLRGLLGKMRLRSDEGLWMIPARGIHTFGLTFPIDAIYLDAQLRVVHLIEDLGPWRIAPMRRQCQSILELPTRSIYGSGTQLGDQLVICSPKNMEAVWESEGSPSSPTLLTRKKGVPHGLNEDSCLGRALLECALVVPLMFQSIINDLTFGGISCKN